MEKVALDPTILSAVPTEAQVEKWHTLAYGEQVKLLNQTLDEASKSEPANATMDDIKARVLRKYNLADET